MTTTRETVYLVWDRGREEHGEAPELVCVYATRAAARQFIAWQPEEDRGSYSIEEKMVLGR